MTTCVNIEEDLYSIEKSNKGNSIIGDDNALVDIDWEEQLNKTKKEILENNDRIQEI